MVQLVDELGTTVGEGEKLAVHESGGQLHRAVSVVLINDRLEMLLQRRSASKYHFVGKWANAGCTHPTLGETPIEAGQRAMRDELGIAPELNEVLRFVYVAHDPISGYTEREYDHVLFGSWSGEVVANPAEVSEVAWISAAALGEWMRCDPDAFAVWFREILRELRLLVEAGRCPHARLVAFVAALVCSDGKKRHT